MALLDYIVMNTFNNIKYKILKMPLHTKVSIDAAGVADA